MFATERTMPTMQLGFPNVNRPAALCRALLQQVRPHGAQRQEAPWQKVLPRGAPAPDEQHAVGERRAHLPGSTHVQRWITAVHGGSVGTWC